MSFHSRDPRKLDAGVLPSISIDSKQELQQMVLHHPHPLVRRLATLILQLHTLGALK
jgi:hypothetical protein